MASEPWARNMDVLRQSTWMNYSNIDQYWIDQGYNKDNLPYIYPNLLKGKIVFSNLLILFQPFKL